MPGLSLGAGVTAQSRTYTTGYVPTYDPATGEFGAPWNAYRFAQGGCALWSVRAACDIDSHWSVALNLSNLLDRTYYSTIGQSGYGNFYAEPRNALLTVKGRF